MSYDISLVVAIRGDYKGKFDEALGVRDPEGLIMPVNVVDIDGHRLYDFGDWESMDSADVIEASCWDLDNPDAFRLVRVGDDPGDNRVEGDFYENPFGLEIVRKVVYDGRPSS